MKIKLIQQYGYSTAGTILDPEKNIADLLIARNIAVPIVDEIVETSASISMPTFKAQKPTIKRKKKNVKA